MTDTRDNTSAHTSARSETTRHERYATHELYRWLFEGHERFGVTKDRVLARRIAEAQRADAFSGSYTDRAVGVAVQVMQSASEYHAAIKAGNTSRRVTTKRTLMRRLQTVQILQAQGKWYA